MSSKNLPILRLVLVVFIYTFSYFLFVSASDITLGSVGNRFSIPFNSGFPINLTFSNDGNFMYIGNFASTIYQFSLPTPYDVTSAVYLNRSKSLSAQGSGMDEIIINNDGDKLFVLQFYNNAVYQYTLTTPHNILSARYDNVLKGVAGQNNYSIYIKPDGTRLYSLSDFNNRINEYSFGTPWDLSTISSNPISTLPTPNFGDGQKLSMGFSPNGESIYIQTDTNERIHWLSMSSPWVISSAKYTSGKYVQLSSTDSSFRALVPNSSGSKLFLMGSGTRSVYEFNLNDTVAPTITSITSSSENGSYTVGDTINLTINFSESVTSSGPLTITLETGDIDRICTINISNSSSGTCDYTVQSGDSTSDLDVIVTGSIYDNSNNFLTNYTPASSLSSLKNIVIDTVTPILSSVGVSNINASSASIYWTTDENTSSLVKYGASDILDFQTNEINTLSKVQNHTVPLNDLVSCTVYYFQALSRDSASNIVESSVNNFKTSGCQLGDIDTGASKKFSISGGTLTFPNSGSLVKIVIPNNYATIPANFQINKLSSDNPESFPENLSLAGNNLFKLNAITENETVLSSFENSITFQIDYSQSISNSFDENTLNIYRYNGSSWDIKDCDLDKINNTINCDLDNFSIYGLFGVFNGEEDTQENNQNDSNSVFHPDKRCHYIVPSELTWITFEKVSDGINVRWSLENATDLDILIDNGTGNYPYKISKTSNDGFIFINNLESWQKIRFIPYNVCKKGEISSEFSRDLYPQGWYRN